MALAIGTIGTWLALVLARAGRPYPSPPFGPGAGQVIGRGELVLAAAAAWAVLWSLSVLAMLLLENGPVPVERGTVVRIQSRQGHLLWPEMPRLPARWYVAIDDGRHDHLRAYRVRPEIGRGSRRDRRCSSRRPAGGATCGSSTS
ncbi:MAG: hypothetical protein FJW88_06480 [Actinobacteria bacterium]|nr:hypothetical protein [Actinomycetota bacterium]